MNAEAQNLERPLAGTSLRYRLAQFWVRLRRWWKRLGKLIIPTAILPVATSWVADYGRELLQQGGLTARDWQLFIIALVVLSAAVIMLLMFAEQALVRISRIAMADYIRPHRIWVATVSRSSWQWQEGQIINNNQSIRFTAGKLDEALDQLKQCRPPWPWEQLLRGLRPHADVVEQVVLLVSPGEKGSEGQAEDCKAALRFLLGLERAQFIIEPCDFTRLDDLLKAYRKIIVHADDAKEVILDVTGGTKIVSIAAAMVSLEHPEVEIQYVETEGEKRVLAFNVVV